VLRQAITLSGPLQAELVGPGGRDGGSVCTVHAAATLRGFTVRGSGWDLSTDTAGILVIADGAEISDLNLADNLHGIYVRGAKDVHLHGNRIVGLAGGGTAAAARAAMADSQRDDGIHHNPPAVRALMGNGIHLWNARGATVEANHVSHVRDGIYVAHTHEARFVGNRIADTRYGIHYLYSSDNELVDNHLTRNVAGAALMFSQRLTIVGNHLHDHAGMRAYGLLLQNVDASHISGNRCAANRAGVRLQYSNGNRFVGNRIAGNLTGLVINASSRDNLFTRNTIAGNLRALELTGPPPPTSWSDQDTGNFWQGSLPIPGGEEGVSLWPHHEVDVLAGVRERFPPAQLLIGSPGIGAVEWALRRAPPPKWRAATDPHPLLWPEHEP